MKKGAKRAKNVAKRAKKARRSTRHRWGQGKPHQLGYTVQCERCKLHRMWSRVGPRSGTVEFYRQVGERAWTKGSAPPCLGG